MNFTEVKISIEYDQRLRIYRIWLFKDEPQHSINYSFDNDGEIIETQLSYGKMNPKVKPFMELNYQIANLLFAKIVDYQMNMGHKTPDVNKIEGKLIATENHLKDLQGFVNWFKESGKIRIE